MAEKKRFLAFLNVFRLCVGIIIIYSIRIKYTVMQQT